MEEEFTWEKFIRSAIKAVSAALAAAAVWFGIEKTTESIIKINENRPNDQKIAPAQEACMEIQAANTSCQNLGKVMSGVTSIIEAINGITNPNQYNNNFGYNNPYSYGCGNSGLFSGPVANPLGMMANNNYNNYNNNGYHGPIGTVNVGNGTTMQFNPDGSHRIYVPGGGGSFAYCTGFPWGYN